MKKILSLLLAFLLALGLLPLNPLPACAAVTNYFTGCYTDLVKANNCLYASPPGQNYIKGIGDSTHSRYILRNSIYPAGIGADEHGNIYIVDSQNKRIVEMDKDDHVVGYYGSFGNPKDVAVDSSGRIYVTDYSRRCLYRMDAGGSHTSTLQSCFTQPYGVAIDSSGNIFVTDTYEDKVVKINSSGSVIATYEDFDFPQGVTVDIKGNAYVADTNNNAVKKIDSSGNITTVGSGFNKPCGIAVDSGGTVYVADSSAVQIITWKPTSITVSPSASSVDYGDSVTLTASGLPADATGTVSFTAGSNTLGTGSVSNGSASCTTSASLEGGTYNVTAAYSGDSNYTGSSATTSFTVNPAVTSVSITGTVKAGETLTANVLPAGATVNSYMWQESDAADGTFSTVGYFETYYLGEGDVGKYFRVIAAGIGRAISEVVGPVKPADAAPVITSAGSTVFTSGSSGTFTVRASGYPTSALSISGTLPTGVGFTDNHNGTATLAGTPATGTEGSYPLTVKASNGIGTAAVQSFTLTVVPPVTLESIAITKPATKTVYTVGDELDISGLEVTGTYSDKSTKVETVTAANVSGFDSTKVAASQTLTVKVGEKTASYTVEIKAAPVTLGSIAITKPATKTVYTVGESLDISGLEVTGTYSDGTKKVETVTAANVTGFDSSKVAASQTLTVTVGGKKTTYQVKISALSVTLQSIAITKPATKTVYTVGESLDISSLEVTGTYSDGTKKVETVTAANVTGFDSSKVAASQTLTVTVGGKKATYQVKISALPVTLQSIAITRPATKTVYTVGESLDISALEVTGTYSDGTKKVETVTAANVTGFDSSKVAASQTLTVTVGGKAVTYAVEISAKEEIESGVISGFSNLADSVKSQTVSLGTAISSINLPQKLKAVVDGISNTFVSVAKWVSSIGYNPNTAGIYDFTPVLDSGYQVKDSGVQLPHITVRVTSGGNNQSSDSDHSSHNSKSSSKAQTSASSTQTSVDASRNTSTVSTVADSTAVNGNTAEISATILNVTTDTTGTNASLNTGTKASVEIELPKDTVIQQLSTRKDVDLTVTVPSDVVKHSNANVAVDIKVDSDILAAAKASQSDVTVKIKDADTQQLAYSWTFKGEDLAKSSVPVANVNISMSVHLTTEVAAVNAATPKNSGMVLSFDHSGLLPAAASVKISAAEKGFKPGQTLYFYYYNPQTKQIEPLSNSVYTVDADGYVTVQISHCSDYVLLPKAARSITLDTKTYCMAPNKSYEIGVKLAGANDTVLKAHSSTRGVANVTVLKNGNIKVTAVRNGSTYIMIDVYDKKNKNLTHASVMLTVQNGVKLNGNSQRQYGTF